MIREYRGSGLGSTGATFCSKSSTGVYKNCAEGSWTHLYCIQRFCLELRRRVRNTLKTHKKPWIHGTKPLVNLHLQGSICIVHPSPNKQGHIWSSPWKLACPEPVIYACGFCLPINLDLIIAGCFFVRISCGGANSLQLSCDGWAVLQDVWGLHFCHVQCTYSSVHRSQYPLINQHHYHRVHIGVEMIWRSVPGTCTTEYTKLQPLLYGVQSVMRVKSVLAGEGGGCTPVAHPLSLHLPLPVKLQCTLHLSGQIHWPCFISTNICTLWPALSAGAYTVGEYTGKDLRFFLSSYSAPPSPPPSKLAPRSCTCCTQRRKTKREEGVQEFEQNKMTAKNVGLFKCIPSTVLGTLFCLLAGPEENLL